MERKTVIVCVERAPEASRPGKRFVRRGDKLDEPLLRRTQDDHGRESALSQRIRSLVEGQSYGVLCTQGGGQPYGSLVAFAFTEDLAALFFGTPTTTRKFHLLSACQRVAMLIDTRATDSSELTRVEAVTVALVRIDVIRYFHVSRFQDVREWVPARDG